MANWLLELLTELTKEEGTMTIEGCILCSDPFYQLSHIKLEQIVLIEVFLMYLGVVFFTVFVENTHRCGSHRNLTCSVNRRGRSHHSGYN